MVRRSNILRPSLVVVLAAKLATGTGPQIAAAPTITIVQLRVARRGDKNHKPQTIEIIATLNTHAVSVSGLSVFYKTAGGTTFTEVKCNRTRKLAYRAEFPYADSSEYYFEATPREGDPIRFGGGNIVGSQLPDSQEERPLPASVLVGLGAAVAFLIPLAGGGGGNPGAGAGSAGQHHGSNVILIVAIAGGAAAAAITYLVLRHRKAASKQPVPRGTPPPKQDSGRGEPQPRTAD